MLPEIAENALIIFMGLDQEAMKDYANLHFPGISFIDTTLCKDLLSNLDSKNEIEDAQIFNFLIEWVDHRTALETATIVGGNWLDIHQRKNLLAIAAKNHVEIGLLIFTDKMKQPKFSTSLIKRFYAAIQNLKQEGFKKIWVLNHISQLQTPMFQFSALPVNFKDFQGPFDVIGDVHGCFKELQALILQLDYQIQFEKGHWSISHPQNRKLVFVGDLADRGPDSVDVLAFVMDIKAQSMALVTKGNHDDKLFRYLKGNKIAPRHGLETTIAELEKKDKSFLQLLYNFIKNLPSHLVLDQGKLVVTHAAILPKYIGKQDSFIEQYCLYGPTNGQLDENGLPERLRWQDDYNGKAWVVYGHTPVLAPYWLGKTLNIDTGAVYGNGLTAFRYPELTTVFQPSYKAYAISKRLEIRQPGSIEKQNLWRSISIPPPGEAIILKGPASTDIYVDHTAASKAQLNFYNAAMPLQAVPYLPPSYPLAPVIAEKEIGNPWPAIEKFDTAGQNDLCAEYLPAGERCVILIVKDELTASSQFALQGFKGSILNHMGQSVFENLEDTNQLLIELHHFITRANWWEKYNSNWFILEAVIQYPEYSRISPARYQLQFLPWLNETKKINESVNDAVPEGPDFKIFSKYWASRANWDQSFDLTFQQYNQPCTSIHSPKLWLSTLVASSNQDFLAQPRNWHLQELQALQDNHSDFIQIPPSAFLVTASTNSWIQVEQEWLHLDPIKWEGIVIKPMRLTNKPVLPGLLSRAFPLHLLYLGPSILDPDWAPSNTNYKLGTRCRLAEEQQWLAQSLLQNWFKASPETYQHLLAILANKMQWLD